MKETSSQVIAVRLELRFSALERFDRKSCRGQAFFTTRETGRRISWCYWGSRATLLHRSRSCISFPFFVLFSQGSLRRTSGSAASLFTLLPCPNRLSFTSLHSQDRRSFGYLLVFCFALVGDQRHFTTSSFRTYWRSIVPKDHSLLN